MFSDDGSNVDEEDNSFKQKNKCAFDEQDYNEQGVFVENWKWVTVIDDL